MSDIADEPDDVHAWKKAARRNLLAQRAAMEPATYREHSNSVIKRLTASHLEQCRGVVGFYWPFRGEIDVTPFMERVLEAGGTAALPVVVAKDSPLQFRAWKPGDKMSLGVYSIPFPAEADVVKPGVLLVALVGFDDACYRLGYGGGYYDRTLLSLEKKPYTIGIGFASSRLATIYPQAYDVPLDVIVTEAGSTRRPSSR